MNKTILIWAAIFGMLSIVLGAFASHGLKPLISEESLQTFETGVRYQMYHAFLLLFLGSTSFIKTRTKKILFYLILVGIVFFSGSIYGLATNEISNFDFKKIAFITPIGGLLLISSWLILLVAFTKLGRDKY